MKKTNFLNFLKITALAFNLALFLVILGCDSSAPPLPATDAPIFAQKINMEELLFTDLDKGLAFNLFTGRNIRHKTVLRYSFEVTNDLYLSVLSSYGRSVIEQSNQNNFASFRLLNQDGILVHKKIKTGEAVALPDNGKYVLEIEFSFADCIDEDQSRCGPGPIASDLILDFSIWKGKKTIEIRIDCMTQDEDKFQFTDSGIMYKENEFYSVKNFCNGLVKESFFYNMKADFASSISADSFDGLVYWMYNKKDISWPIPEDLILYEATLLKVKLGGYQLKCQAMSLATYPREIIVEKKYNLKSCERVLSRVK